VNELKKLKNWDSDHLFGPNQLRGSAPGRDVRSHWHCCKLYVSVSRCWRGWPLAWGHFVHIFFNARIDLYDYFLAHFRSILFGTHLATVFPSLAAPPGEW